MREEREGEREKGRRVAAARRSNCVCTLIRRRKCVLIPCFER